MLFNPLRKALLLDRRSPFPYPPIVGLVRCLFCVYTLFVLFVVHVNACTFRKWDERALFGIIVAQDRQEAGIRECGK